MAETQETKISLKVVIDRVKKKVVFAEGYSDFVDVLFSFLTLPMGTIVRLSAKCSDPSHAPANVGGYNNLYESVAKLKSMYFKGERCKNMLLSTRSSAEQHCQKLKINIDDTEPIKYFICSNECFDNFLYSYFSTDGTVFCKACRAFLNKATKYVEGTSLGKEGVFVTKTSSFVISDDLHVIPNNPTSTLGILESSGIENFAALEEKEFKLGSYEFIHLLERSFSSKTPLSDIYFGTKSMNSQVPIIQSPIPTESTDSSKKMEIKIYVQKSSNRILLAHCSEDFIDFLFSCLTIPLGKVLSLLTKNQESTLSIENMHQSVLELNVHEYLRSQQVKDMLLNPKLVMYYLGSNHIFPLDKEPDTNMILNRSLSAVDKYYLSNCKSSFSIKELTDVSPKHEGYVRGPTKFMVTDDLFVSPLSSMSCFKYLDSLKVPPKDIEEQMIKIGMKEALQLLRASVTSTSVLSNGLKFFILKTPKQETSRVELKSERSFKKPKVEK